jgi:hypothetical protein
MEKLNVKGVAVGVGVSWAVCMLFARWASIFGWGVRFVEVMASVYIGFKPTFLGRIMGTL